jgi:Tol biopolymer transport system component/tRNA A-37 threonylcarbamoyl transferase component Bud32
VGPYEILAALGAGGMGEVYRARDTKLGRDVAIKVLPSAFAHDPDRMARFQREAKVLASLNHPHIATIHGLEESDGARALVMELVEGPTLAERLTGPPARAGFARAGVGAGPIPVEEAIAIVRQIAEALEAAHERGIVHRDLKPANIKLTQDGAVKVLDFGLAKAMEGEASAADLANSPTLSQMATQAGVLLGTAAYMAPEQAKGKAVDKRADIWAFGCVLYEMLTGKMAFRGETVTDTLAAVMKEEPDWTKLPGSTPLRVRVLLMRCLEKDPRQRLRDIGEARIALEEALSGAADPTTAAPAAPSVRRQLWLRDGAVVLLALVAAWLAFLYPHQKPSPGQVIRFEISAPEKTVLSDFLALSPDGRRLAFTATGADGQTRVWVRSLDALESRPLDGTEDATYFPFWSPDSRFIAFYAQGKLKKIDATGGPAVTLCEMPYVVLGGAWSPDDQIVFGSSNGLYQVSASGGSAAAITANETAVSPSFLPDGRHFTYLHDASSGVGIFVGSVGMKPGEQPKKLLSDHSDVVYVPSGDPAVGRLLFVRGARGAGALGTLMAQPFDTRRLELTGEAVPLAEQVSNVDFSASATGVLVYLAGSSRLLARGQLTWFDREGKVLGKVGDPDVIGNFSLSPDGKRIAFRRVDPQKPITQNLWLYEFARGVTTRFTFDSRYDEGPVWSPDGSRIAFVSNRSGTWDLYQKAANLAGEDELLFKASGRGVYTHGWSPDGRFLLYDTEDRPIQFGLLSLGGGTAEHKPALLTKSEFNEGDAHFSPDGRWIGYVSDESGRNEVYVRPFDAASAMGSSSSSSSGAMPLTGKWMVSKDGGISPLWRRDGKELFYLSPDGMAMAVEVSTSGVFQAGVPKPLFKTPRGVEYWDISADGKRFLMAAPSVAATVAQPSFTVVLNWQAGLKK